MPALSVHLFGKFCVRSSQAELAGFESRKVQELFGYLALYRGRPHPREAWRRCCGTTWPARRCSSRCSPARSA